MMSIKFRIFLNCIVLLILAVSNCYGNHDFIVKNGFYRCAQKTITRSDYYKTYIVDVKEYDNISFQTKTNCDYDFIYDVFRVLDRDDNILMSIPNKKGEKIKINKSVTVCKGGAKLLLTCFGDRSFLNINNTEITLKSVKEVVWFGTSIPEGQYNGIGTSYPEIISKKLGVLIYNESVGSSRVTAGRCRENINQNNPFGFPNQSNFENCAKCLTNSSEVQEWLIQNYSSSLFTSGQPKSMTDELRRRILSWGYENKLDKYLTKETFPDLFVFDHGRNDYRYTFDTSDPYSVYGNSYQNGMNFLIKRILEYNPKAKIVIIGHYTNQKRSSTDLYSVYDDPVMCTAAQIEVAEYWQIPILRLWEKTGWSNKIISVRGKEMSVLASWMPDQLHPHSDSSGKAINHLANLIAPFIKEHIY